MFKKIGAIFLVLLFIFLIQSKTYAHWFKKKPKSANTVAEAVFVPVNNVNDNIVWVGTFQLIWNDLVDEILKTPIVFSDFKSPLAEALNKKGFNTSYLSENSYYKKYGKISRTLKSEIEHAIKAKFNEKSDVLGNINWDADGMLIYAMLKKDFQFLKQFKELGYDYFMNKQVKFFGINSSVHDKAVRNNVDVLFYNSENDFSVKLKTKNNEEVILYRTNDNKSLEKLYADLNKKAKAYNKDNTFEDDDILKVPYIKFNECFKYDELERKPIQGTDFVIDSAIQTVKFNLDNKGGSLKSEAVIAMTMSMMPSIGRNFIFDGPFLLVLKEQDKELPYFMVHFKNADLFVKEQ